MRLCVGICEPEKFAKEAYQFTHTFHVFRNLLRVNDISCEMAIFPMFSD